MEQDNEQNVTIPEKSANDEHLLLSNWKLPEEVLKQYDEKGIKRMFEWQYECLSKTEVLMGKNLVVSAPTSAGKMLVAEIIAIECLLKGKKVMIVQPYISAVRETTSTFQFMFENMLNVSVQGFAGSDSPNGRFSEDNISVYTIEKAIGPVIDLLKNDHELGLIVVDELHMIGDKERGGNLEFLLTNILYMNRYRNLSSKVQIVGLSATLSDVDSLANWLDAVPPYETDFRPITLKERLQIDNNVFEKISSQNSPSQESLSQIGLSQNTESTLQRVKTKNTELSEICFERMSEGHSVIIFCATKCKCVSLAKELAEKSTHEAHEDLHRVCDKLKSYGSNAPWDIIIPKGIAFHHADLTLQERAVIVEAFRERHLKIILATTTLSCGVNLPARLVIVTTPNIYGMNALMYKQMIGRAGRKGLDEVGESILMCTKSEKRQGCKLFQSDPEPVDSAFFSSTKSQECSGSILLRRGLLEVLAAVKLSMTKKNLWAYFSCTFFHHISSKASNGKERSYTENTEPEDTVFNNAMEFLQDNRFIKAVQPNSESVGEDKFQATELGLITAASYLSPEQVQVVYEEIEKVNSTLVKNPGSPIPLIHAIYLVVLILLPSSKWPKLTQKDRQIYLRILNDQSKEVQTFFKEIGCTKFFLTNKKKALSEHGSLKRKQLIQLHQNFFIALVLILKQEDDQNKGVKTIPAKELIELQDKVIISASALASFCKQCKWKDIASEIEGVRSYFAPDMDDRDSNEDIPQENRKRLRSQSPSSCETDKMSPAKNLKLTETEVPSTKDPSESKILKKVCSSDVVTTERRRQKSVDSADAASPTKMKLNDKTHEDKENIKEESKIIQEDSSSDVATMERKKQRHLSLADITSPTEVKIKEKIQDDKENIFEGSNSATPELSIANLAEVQDQIWEAQAKWYNIGLALELSAGTLDAIEGTHSSIDVCYRKMLQNWLQSGAENRTWKHLAEILKRKSIGYSDLSKTILSNHYQ